MRLMESLSDPSDGLRAYATCHTRAYFPPSFPFQFGVQSFRVFLVMTFRVVILSLTFMVIQFSLAFKAIVFRLAFGAIVSFWRSEPLFAFRLAFRAVFLVLGFRAICPF